MIEQHYCTSWNELKSYLANRLYEGRAMARGRFLYRGHGDSQWPLCSTFDRAFPEFGGKKRDDLEQELVTQFKKQCEADDRYRELVGNELATLALAQHFGLPTRLLDWTESPYVAAFFAFAGHFQASVYGASLSAQIAIWVLDSSSYIWSESRGVQVIAPETWLNARLRQQSGWFTLSRTPFRSLEEYVEQFSDAAGALRKIMVPATAVKQAIADLDLMNINHATLFPDMEGRSRAAVTRALLNLMADQ